MSVEEENCGWDVTSLFDGQVERYTTVNPGIAARLCNIADGMQVGDF